MASGIMVFNFMKSGLTEELRQTRGVGQTDLVLPHSCLTLAKIPIEVGTKYKVALNFPMGNPPIIFWII